MPIRVMLVDDHRVVRQGLHSLLADAPGIELVGEAGDGFEALAQVEALRPDVMLLDVRMPGMDGLETTRRLQQTHPEVRIVILTTYAEDEYLVEALRSGAQGYLLKNIEYDDLVKAIKDVYQGARRLAPDLVGRVMELAGNLARGQASATTAAAPAHAPTPASAPDFPGRFDLRFGPGSWQRLVAWHRQGMSMTEMGGRFGNVSAQTLRKWLLKGGAVKPVAGRGRPPKTQEERSGLSEREQEVLRLVATGLSNKEIAARLGIRLNTVRVHVHDIFRKLGIKTRTQAALHVLRAGDASTDSAPGGE